MANIEITTEMMEAYAELIGDSRRLGAAVRLGDIREMNAVASQLLHVSIPKYLREVPEKVRKEFGYGNDREISFLEQQAMQYAQ